MAKPKAPPPPALEQIKKDVKAAADEWLSDMFYEQGGYDMRAVSNYVGETLSKLFRSLLLHSAGIEESWGSATVRYDSPLKETLKDAAREQANLWFDAYFKDAQRASELPVKFRSAIVKYYREAYEKELLELAKRYGTETAQSDFKKLALQLMGDASPEAKPEEDE